MKLNCQTCKRTLLWGEVFANGYTDGPTICHSCKKTRNHFIAAKEAISREEKP